NKIIGLNHGTILNAITKTGENIFVDVTAYDAYNSARTIVAVRALSNKFLELQNLLDDYQTTKSLVSNRDCFLSNLKFDFITPLNASLGFSQSLLDKVCGDINEKQEKYLNIINSNNKKLKRLMDKVFDVILLDADKREFSFKTFNFVNITDYVIETHKNAIEDKGLKFNFNNEVNKRNIYSDEYAFAQVLEILLENAIKFTENGEITITVAHPDIELLEQNEIKIPTGYSEKSYLKVDISDTGIGVDEDKLSDIFDEYSTKNLAIAQKYEGTALSLPIARKIIHKLNGSVWCNLNAEKGTTFTFLIPVERMKFE
ncbi:MAG: HAMP domain-containing histidine kinase, partial [Candidatus Gastranaerophilales bacterium]|nr:HAMP domain-containing histidine kinase [Candidatus Gastranaerophilales bacterium]